MLDLQGYEASILKGALVTIEVRVRHADHIDEVGWRGNGDWQDLC